MAEARRLSKVLIVKETTRHLRDRRNLCIAAARDVRKLLAENARLASELSALRTRDGESDIPPIGSMHITEAMAGLMGIESEDMGKFPDGFGETWAGRPLGDAPSKDEGTRGEGEDRRVMRLGSPGHDYRDGTQPGGVIPESGVLESSQAFAQIEQSYWSPGISFDYGVEPSLDFYSELFGGEPFPMPGILNNPSDLQVGDEPSPIDIGEPPAHDIGTGH